MGKLCALIGKQFVISNRNLELVEASILSKDKVFDYVYSLSLYTYNIKMNFENQYKVLKI